MDHDMNHKISSSTWLGRHISNIHETVSHTGLFTADQKLTGSSMKHTRQNPNGIFPIFHQKFLEIYLLENHHARAVYVHVQVIGVG